MALLDQLKRQFEGPDKAKITAAVIALAAVVLIVAVFIFPRYLDIVVVVLIGR